MGGKVQGFRAEKGKGQRKGEGRENLGGQAHPKYFFLEPRLRQTSCDSIVHGQTCDGQTDRHLAHTWRVKNEYCICALFNERIMHLHRIIFSRINSLASQLHVKRFFLFLSFYYGGGTRSFRMSALRPASHAGQMRNPRDGTSVVQGDTIRLT